MRINSLYPRFVDEFPDILVEGVLYICLPAKTMVHLCACGCRSEVYTPISPDGWTLKYDGEAVTLSPSIGNWDFPCKSHYFVRGNQIVESYDFDTHMSKLKTKKKKRKKWFFF